MIPGVIASSPERRTKSEVEGRAKQSPLTEGQQRRLRLSHPPPPRPPDEESSLQSDQCADKDVQDQFRQFVVDLPCRCLSGESAKQTCQNNGRENACHLWIPLAKAASHLAGLSKKLIWSFFFLIVFVW